MDYLWIAFKTLGAIAVMTLIVPLIVLGGSGSWRRAVDALRWYWIIVGGASLIVSCAALLVVALELIDSATH